MVQTTQGSLVMVGLNTDTPSVFWDGTKLDGIKFIQVTNDGTKHSVVLGMDEDPTIAKLRDAGITIRRI